MENEVKKKENKTADMKKYRRERYLANKEKYIERNRKWRQNNPEKYKAMIKRAWEKNGEHHKEVQKEYIEKNREKWNEYQREYQRKKRAEKRDKEIEKEYIVITGDAVYFMKKDKTSDNI